MGSLAFAPPPQPPTPQMRRGNQNGVNPDGGDDQNSNGGQGGGGGGGEGEGGGHDGWTIRDLPGCPADEKSDEYSDFVAKAFEKAGALPDEAT